MVVVTPSQLPDYPRRVADDQEQGYEGRPRGRPARQPSAVVPNWDTHHQQARGRFPDAQVPAD